VSLERVHVATGVQPGGKARISIKARLYNPGAATNPVDMRVKISDPDGKMLRDAPLQGVAPWTGDRELLSLEIAPQLWSPATPKLYNCDVTLDGQQGRMSVAERFGLRHFEFVEHGPFKLNGERLLLRGTCLHEDWAGVAGAVPDDLNRKQMVAMKEMGANMVRLGHYQQSDVVLDSCDELGILVWEEIPWCRGGIGKKRYRDQAGACCAI
jgi:beta-galactosidase